MIRWLVQTVADHPDLSMGRPPAGLLMPAELEKYEGYHMPRRRRDWLLGRWTAKQLVQTQIAATDGFRPALDTFSIAYDESGAPYVASTHPALCRLCQDSRIPLAISISHSSGYAFCAVCHDDSGVVRVGVDVELVEARPTHFGKEFFTATEQANILAAPPELRDLLTTATWSVKEATLKATHHALRADPRHVTCWVHPTRSRHWTPLRVHLEPALRAQSGMSGPLRVGWRVLDNRLRPGTLFVLTLAALGATL